MSFIPTTRHRVQRDIADESLADDITDAIQRIGTTIMTAGKVAEDPYLPEVVCRVNQLYAIEHGQRPPPCPATPLNRTGGIGLRTFVRPLRAYVYAEQHPAAKVAGIALAIGLPFALGYLLGKRSS